MFDALFFNTDSIKNELLMTFFNASLYGKIFQSSFLFQDHSCKNYKSFHFQLNYLLKQTAPYQFFFQY